MVEHLSTSEMMRMDTWRLLKNTVTSFSIFKLNPKYPINAPGEDFVPVSMPGHLWTSKDIAKISPIDAYFVKKVDEQAWERYQEQNANPIKGEDTKELVKNIEDVAIDLYSSCNRMTIDEEVVADFKSLAVGVVHTLRKAADAVKYIRGLFEHSQFLYFHSTGVGLLAPAIALEMGEASDAVLREYALGGLLHDVGMLDIPESILLKPGKLSPSEWELVHKHPKAGLAKLTNTPAITKRMKNMMLMHHERIDGSGYPDKLTNPLIPDEAKLMAVADVYTALTASRPYRAKRNHFEGLMFMKHQLQDQLWPDAFRALVRVLLGEEHRLD